MLRKLVVIVLTVAVYCLGIVSGIAFLGWPVFSGCKSSQANIGRHADTDALRFKADNGYLLIFRNAADEAAKGVMEVEFKNGKVMKKGPDEVIGVLNLK